MSTLELDLKLTCQSGVNVNANVVTASTDKEKVGSFQDASGHDQWLNGASTEPLHSTKNLCIGRNLLLKASRVGGGSIPGGLGKTSGQLRFTSFFSLTLPYKRSKWNTEGDRTALQLSSNQANRRSGSVRAQADSHHPELWEKAFSCSTFDGSHSTACDDKDVSAFEEGGAKHSRQNHVEFYLSDRSSTEGIQCSVAWRGQTQTAENCTQRESLGSDYLTEQCDTESHPGQRESGVSCLLGENVEGTGHSNLIHLRGDGGLKSSTDCQTLACSPGGLKQASSLPSFHALHLANNLETKISLITPTSVMFTSTIVSVLAPHWSLRRPKKSINEVGQDIQATGQNSSFTSSSQNARQKSLLLNHVQSRGEATDKFSGKGLEVPSRKYAPWRKESSSPNPTPSFQTRRSLLESSSWEADRQRVHRIAECDTSAPQVPKPALSAQLSGYKRMSEGGDQRESFSSPNSRPTSSSLLLSWRRNSRKASAQAEKRVLTSVHSLTLPRNTRLGSSQQHTPMVSPGADKSPVSPKGQEMETSRKSLFLSKRESDLSDNTLSPRNDSVRDGRFLNSPTRLGNLQHLKGFQHNPKDVQERKYSHVGNRESEERSITDYTNTCNSNNNRPHRTFDYPSTSVFLHDNANSNVIHSWKEFNNGNLNSHSYCISDSKRQISQTSAVIPSQQSGASWQSDSTHNIINYSNTNTIHTPSVSKSTVPSASQTIPNTVQLLSVSPSAGLTSMPMNQGGQNSIQNSEINKSVWFEKCSPGSVNSVSSKTFTNSLNLSPKKEPSAVEGTSPSRVWQGFLNSQTESAKPQIPSDQTSLPSPPKPRRAFSLSVYTYLRETSPSEATGTSARLSSATQQPASLKQDEEQIQRRNKNAEASRFTFDLSLIESQDSCTFNSPQSLPPDTGIKTRSPYASLISARPALNSTLQSPSSLPVTHQQRRSASYVNSAMHSNPPKTEKNTYPSLKGKDSFIPWAAGKPASSVEDQISEKTAKTSESCRSPQNTRYMGHHTVNFMTDTTHPKEYNVISKNIPYKAPDSTFSSQIAKVSPQELNYKDLSSPLNTPAVNETFVQQGNMTSSTHETLQRLSGSPNSKTNLFSLRSEKNNLFFPSADKGSEDNLTVRKKNFNQQTSDFKISENIIKEEERYPKSQILKSPLSSNTQAPCTKESLSSSSPMSGFTFRNRKQENTLTVDEPKRLSDENGNQSPRRSLSPHWPIHHHVNRYATMPQSRRTSLLSFAPFYPVDIDLANVQDDDVFYSTVSRRRYSSLCETKDASHPGKSGRKHFTQDLLSAPCADLMYGLERGRSVSVNSVVSGRPSGPGRISTGSKPGSTTDLTGLDESVTRSSHSSMSSLCDSPRYGAGSPSNHPTHNTYKGDIGGLLSGGRIWSPVNLENPFHAVDTEANPTPPPSPPFSPSSRRMARIPSSSSTSSRTSQDSLSPRGHLPSRDYKSTLPVFEESPQSSDTTTDDEYYINSDDDDEKETEL